MKKLKKIILSVLLFTFAFISVHDYVVLDFHTNDGYEFSYLGSSEDTIVDLTSHVHDSIHTLLVEPPLETMAIVIVSSYQKQFELRDLFTSHISSVLQRPPLA